MAREETPKNAPAHVTGAQAAALLGVKPQTLYAYVSRGLIRSVATAGSPKRLYSRDDIEKLRSRSEARSGHGPAAAAAMHWGEPIIQTAITEITPEGPRYRGRPVLELARSGRSFENVAELLWTGRYFEEPITWELEAAPADVSCFTRCLDRFCLEKPLPQVMSYITLCVNMMLGRSVQRVRYSTSIIAARQLMLALTGCFGYLRRKPRYVKPQAGLSVAHSILRACELEPTAENVRGVNAMMVLLADHELSPATFAARIAASSGADLYTCLVCALETGSGSKVGQVYEQTGEFLLGAPGKPQLLRKATAMQAAGQLPPGFNHPAYPGGDPRTRVLLDLAWQIKDPAVRLKGLHEFLEEVGNRFDLKPRLELGVVALGFAMGLHRGAAAGIFSLARMSGWVAHILEQRLSSAILRPRARYVAA